MYMKPNIANCSISAELRFVNATNVKDSPSGDCAEWVPTNWRLGVGPILLEVPVSTSHTLTSLIFFLLIDLVDIG